MVWLVSSPYLTEEAAKPCIINTTSRTTQISKEYLSKLHIIWGRGSRSFTTLFFRKGRLPAKMDFRSEVCYLNVDSLEFLAFRWNGYEPEWYFIPNFGHILAINVRNMDKDVPPIIFLDETVTFNPAELFHNAIFCWALQCHLQHWHSARPFGDYWIGH